MADALHTLTEDGSEPVDRVGTRTDGRCPVTEDPRIGEIRAVLDDPAYDRPKSGREVHRNNDEKLARIRAILDRPWSPSVGEKVTGVETQTIGQPTVTGWFHSSGVDGLSWLKIREDDSETAQRYLVATDTLRPYTPPAPRVFFPGDTVPAGVWTVAEGINGRTTSPACSAGPRTVRLSPKLEVFMPTLQEFRAAVARAHAEREEASRG